MFSHAVSSRELVRTPGRAKRLAAEGPVLVTERRRPAFVLLKIDDYDRLCGRPREIALLDLMDSMPRTDGVDYEAPQAIVKLEVPED